MFIDDDNYIQRIFEGINQDIEVHQYFMKYLEYYDETVLEEWINDEKREKHLKNIKSIKDLDDIDLSKKMLLYFLVYSKKDNLKHEIFNDVKMEIKSYLIDEILPETVSTLLPGGKLVYKIAKLIYNQR